MRAYMKPRMRPSRTTWGKMPMSRSKSIGWGPSGREGPEGPYAAAPPVDDQVEMATTSSPPGWRWLRLLPRGGGDGQLLDDLVVAPLLGIFVRDLKNEILGLLAVTLRVEGDVASDPGELRLPHGRGDVLAGELALGRLLDRQDGDVGGVVGLRRIGLGILSELLLEVVDERLGFGQGRCRAGRRGVVHADHGLASDLRQVRRVHAVGPHELGLDALLARLLEEGRSLVVDSAEVDHVRVLEIG